jgi:hypothetical protein
LFVAGLAVIGITLWAGVSRPGQTAGKADKSRERKAAAYVTGSAPFPIASVLGKIVGTVSFFGSAVFFACWMIEATP